MNASLRPAVVRYVSTEWGSGSTCCFLCGQTFTYSLRHGARIPHLSTDELCDRPCTGDGTHRWDCAALGGDLCGNCAVQLENAEDEGNVWCHVQSRAEALRRQAEILDAYADANAEPVAA